MRMTGQLLIKQLPARVQTARRVCARSSPACSWGQRRSHVCRVWQAAPGMHLYTPLSAVVECAEACLLALEAAQVLRLVGARAPAHDGQQLRLHRRQVVAVAAAGALPLVLLTQHSDLQCHITCITPGTGL